MDQSMMKESDIRTCTQHSSAIDLPPPDRRSMYRMCPCILTGRQLSILYQLIC
jgi:hypothetical protein